MSLLARWSAAAILAPCIVLVGAAALLGQKEPRRDAQTSAGEVRTTSTVLKAKVTLRGGDSIGTVTDLVIGEGGCVEYVIVTYEERYVLVPWTAIKVNYTEQTVAVDLSLAAFKSVPTFTRTSWSNLSDRAFLRRVNTAFGIEGRRGSARQAEDDDERPKSATRKTGKRKADRSR